MDAELIKRYREDPVAFLEEIHGIKLYEFQKIIVREMFKHDNKDLRITYGRANGRKWLLDAIEKVENGLR